MVPQFFQLFHFETFHFWTLWHWKELINKTDLEKGSSTRQKTYWIFRVMLCCYCYCYFCCYGCCCATKIKCQWLVKHLVHLLFMAAVFFFFLFSYFILPVIYFSLFLFFNVCILPCSDSSMFLSLFVFILPCFILPCFF